MKYDHIIPASDRLTDQNFHLACGYCTTTSFLFEQANFAVVIDCKGIFTFYAADGVQTGVIQVKPMRGGRGCYMDVFITTTDGGVTFRLPDYEWYDNYPNCDGESDRWDTRIIGIADEVVYPG